MSDMQDWLSTVKRTYQDPTFTSLASEGVVDEICPPEFIDYAYSLPQIYGYPADTESESDTTDDDDVNRPRHRHRQQVERLESLDRLTPSSVSEDDDSLNVDTLDGQYFQYNGRILASSLPGLILVLLLGGDMLLTVVSFGALVVYLLEGAGEDNKALFAYLVSFICTQITVVYSAVPFLWKSLYNVMLVLGLNTYATLTGAWFVLRFKVFLKREPALAQLIEMMLFTLYPAVSVVLITWAIVTVTTIHVAPYLFIVFGFLFLQVFLTPTPSSFCLSAVKNREQTDIMEPTLQAVIVTMYSMCPPALFLFVHTLMDFWAITTFNVLVEWFFISSSSVFLATFFDLRLFLEISDVDERYFRYTRWAAGLASVALCEPVLHLYGFSFHLLPWLPVGVALHAAYGYCLSLKDKKLYGTVAASIIAAFYLVLCTQFPWKLAYYIGEHGLHINIAYLLLVLNAILCLSSAFASVYSTKEIFGALFLISSLGFTGLCKLVKSDGIFYQSGYLFLSMFLIYLSLRIYLNRKLLWQHALPVMSLHQVAVIGTFITVDKTGLPQGGALSSVYLSLGLWLICAVITYVILFEDADVIDNEKLLRYFSVVVLCSILNLPGCLHGVYYIFTRLEPGIADYLGLFLCVVGSVALKLGLCHKCELQPTKFIGVMSLILALLLFCVQPTFSLTLFEILKLTIILSLVSGLILVPLGVRNKSLSLIAIWSFAIGCSGSMGVSSTFFPTLRLQSTILYGVQLSLCLIAGLVTWAQVKDLERLLLKLYLCLTTVVVASVIGDFLLDTTITVWTSPSTKVAALVFIAMATVLKFLSLQEQGMALNTRGEVRISYLPLIGNICTIVAFLLTCMISPLPYWEPWVLVCSGLLLLLQNDHIVMRKLSGKNNLTPLIFIVTFVFITSALVNSLIWTAYGWRCFQGFCELLIITVTLPAFFVLMTVLWNERFYISDKTVVFLTPLFSLLFLIGTSYSSYGLGALGLTSCVWLMKVKLPLLRER